MNFKRIQFLSFAYVTLFSFLENMSSFLCEREEIKHPLQARIFGTCEWRNEQVLIHYNRGISMFLYSSFSNSCCYRKSYSYVFNPLFYTYILVFFPSTLHSSIPTLEHL